MRRFRVALLGLAGAGADYLSAIRADEHFELVALGHVGGESRRASSLPNNVPVYEDLRSLIVECGREGLDLVFVALEPFQSREFVELAGERGIGVFHKPPFGRTVSEAREVLAAFAPDGPPFVVPRSWHYDPAHAKLADLDERVGGIHAVTATITTTDSPVGWRGDSVRAGGGVLLNGAYEWVDLLVSAFGVPELVYCECGRAASAGTSRSYDTEDFAAVTLRFRRDRIGSLIARRGAADSSHEIAVFGARGEAVLRDNESVLRVDDGEEVRTPVEVQDPVAAALEAFGAALRGELRRLPDPAADQLATLAVIDAAYLSAKTGAPESPAQFLPEY